MQWIWLLGVLAATIRPCDAGSWLTSQTSHCGTRHGRCSMQSKPGSSRDGMGWASRDSCGTVGALKQDLDSSESTAKGSANRSCVKPCVGAWSTTVTVSLPFQMGTNDLRWRQQAGGPKQQTPAMPPKPPLPEEVDTTSGKDRQQQAWQGMGIRMTPCGDGREANMLWRTLPHRQRTGTPKTTRVSPPLGKSKMKQRRGCSSRPRNGIKWHATSNGSCLPVLRLRDCRDWDCTLDSNATHCSSSTGELDVYDLGKGCTS